MFLITPFLVICMFTILLIVALTISFTSKSYDTSRARNFIGVLSGLGIFMTFIFYYNLIQLQHESVRASSVQELNEVKDKLLNNLYGQMAKSVKTIPDFVFSLNPLSRELCDENYCNKGESTKSEKSKQACIEKMILSEKIFYIWQDVVTGGDYVKKNRRFFIMQFLQNAYSSELEIQWNIMDKSFSPKTRELGNLLFEYAKKVKEPTKDNFSKTLDDMIDDKRYTEVFNMKDSKIYKE